MIGESELVLPKNHAARGTYSVRTVYTSTYRYTVYQVAKLPKLVSWFPERNLGVELIRNRQYQVMGRNGRQSNEPSARE